MRLGVRPVTNHSMYKNEDYLLKVRSGGTYWYIMIAVVSLDRTCASPQLKEICSRDLTSQQTQHPWSRLIEPVEYADAPSLRLPLLPSLQRLLPGHHIHPSPDVNGLCFLVDSFEDLLDLHSAL
jgi:hypothetical protein